MKGQRILISTLILGFLLALAGGLSQAQGPEPQGGTRPMGAVGSAFTYQGRLTDGGNPANGEYDFRFRLYDAASGDTAVTGYIEANNVQVTNSVFTVQLNFGGGIFTGEACYLEIAVRPGDSYGAYTTLTPRQVLTPVPYALALPGLWTQQNSASPNLVGGYNGNSMAPSVVGATIGGGGRDGDINQVTADYGTVGGGMASTAGGEGATVGGGGRNDAADNYATVGGGYQNTASSHRATVSGGGSNTSGWYATVSGGVNNTASGSYAAIPGGSLNTAAGSYSFAAGRRAKANNQGCFVWGDSTTADVTCNNDNRWVARASGGVYFYTNSELTSGAYLPAGSSSWSTISDRNFKENVDLVDAQAILARLVEIPLTTWNYKTQAPAIRHIGPMAQDFYAAFGLGEDEQHISTIDADGVALAAIQGLYELAKEQAVHIQALEAENAALQGRLDSLEARLAVLEQVVTFEEEGQ